MPNPTDPSPHQRRNPTTGLDVSALSAGAQVTLWGIREWVDCAHNRRDVAAGLRVNFQQLRHPRLAIDLLDEWMSTLSAGAVRNVRICRHTCSCVNVDEQLLLEALQGLERGEITTAPSVLRPLLRGGLARAFCRSALLYVEELNASGATLVGRRYLQAVT
ncbi:MAG: hypothetical protein AAF515_03695 [Pseudomonadota bacterium]